MKYDELYKTFKEEIPEGSSFFEVKEKENLIDETDGIHIVFGRENNIQKVVVMC